jgi:hypothetical protein
VRGFSWVGRAPNLGCPILGRRAGAVLGRRSQARRPNQPKRAAASCMKGAAVGQREAKPGKGAAVGQREAKPGKGAAVGQRARQGVPISPSSSNAGEGWRDGELSVVFQVAAWVSRKLKTTAGRKDRDPAQQPLTAIARRGAPAAPPHPSPCAIGAAPPAAPPPIGPLGQLSQQRRPLACSARSPGIGAAAAGQTLATTAPAERYGCAQGAAALKTQP